MDSLPVDQLEHQKSPIRSFGGNRLLSPLEIREYLRLKSWAKALRPCKFHQIRMFFFCSRF